MNDELYTPRKVNLLAIGVVVLATAGFGAGLYFLYNWQVRRNAADFLSRSRQAEDEGQLSKAADYLMQYLTLKQGTNQDEHFAHYADLSQKLAANPNQMLRALFLIDQALRRKPDQDHLRRAAARMAANLGRFKESLYKDALYHLEELRKGKTEDDLELMHLEARVMVGLKKYPQATELYQQVCAKAPENIPAWEERLVLERDLLKNPPGADVFVLRMLELNPKSVPAHQVAARHYLRRGNLDKALELVTIAQDKLGARLADLYLLGAELAAIKGRGAEARKRLAEALKHFPDDALMRLTAARIELRLGDARKSRELLEPFRKNLPRNPEHLCELGSLLIDLDGESKEIDVIRGRLSAPATVWASTMLAGQQHMRKKEWGKARVMLEKLRLKRLPGTAWERQIDLMLADCFRALGSPDQQVKAAERALESDPSSPAARMRLGQALAASGKIDKAVETFGKLADGEPDAHLTRLRILLARQQLRKEKDRDWSFVEKAFEELPEKDKDSLEASALRVELAVARGQLQEALKLAEAARDRNPKQAGSWLFLFEVARMMGKPARALALLEEAEGRLGPRIDWQIARLRLAMSTGGKDGLDQVRKVEEYRRGLKDGERGALTAPLAQAFGQLGDGPSAQKLFLELAELQPNNLEVRVMLAERAWRAGKFNVVGDYVQEVVKAEGADGPVGAYLKAIVSLENERTGYDEARKYLKQAGNLRPSWSRVPSLEGELDDREEKRESAVGKYTKAIELGEGRVGVLQRAIVLLFELGRFTEADALLRRLPETIRLAGEFGRLSGALKLLSGEEGTPKERRQQALTVARKVVQGGTSDFRNYVFLGQMATLAGETKEAEQALLKAREIAPKEPIPWVALIQFFARTDLPRAKKELAEAERILPAKPAALALASCHEALGQLKEAQKFYEAARDFQPNNAGVLATMASFLTRQNQVEKAQEVWNKVLEPSTRATDTERRAARRALAVLLALSKSYPAYKKAVALIETNLKGQEAVEDRRAQALVMATQPADRRDAIRLFEKLSPTAANTPPEMLYLLMRLCEAEPDLKSKALDYLEVLLRNAPDNPGYLSYAAMAYLRESQFDQATGVIDRLAKNAGDTFEVAELRARLLKAKGQPDEARRLIEAQVKGKDERLVPGALILDSLGEHAAAESMYRRLAFALNKPEGLLLLAEHLSRRKRAGEALEVCEQAWRKAKPEESALVSLRVLRENGGTAEQQERVAGWLVAAQKKQPTSVALLACLAELEDLRGRYDAVVSLYRRLLGLQPENIVALNNLAYYLSVKEGKHDEALTMLAKVIDARGPIGEILDTRGLIRLGAGKAEEALRDFQAAVKQDPAPLKLFHLAQGHLAAGELPAARGSFRRAKAQGLKEEQLPPLERPAWKELTKQLGAD